MRIRIGVFILAASLAGCAATVRKSVPADTMAETNGRAATSAVATPSVPIPRASSSRLILNLGGSPESLNANDWEGFKAEWRVNFVAKADDAGIAFEIQDGTPRPTGEDGTLLVVYVDQYRFVRPGMRIAFGVFTGNAYIRSRFTFMDLKTGTTLGTQRIDTSSSFGQGVFAPVTNKQVEAIAADVVAQLKAAKVAP